MSGTRWQTPLSGGGFVMIHKGDQLREAQLTVGARNFLLVCREQMDGAGHAYFGLNEAEQAVQKLTGRWPADKTMQKWRRELYTAGIADREFSSPRCVVLFGEYGQHGSRRKPRCPHHGNSTARSWRDGNPDWSGRGRDAGSSNRSGPERISLQSGAVTPF